ncbi:hypothetical protein ABC478_03375 [Mycoplasmopsis synoviae]|uniref:hypothetical protein n=1 Tax=Mycoplasmopsis synoviae TaxID=2109 RepID=UPI00356A9B65
MPKIVVDDGYVEDTEENNKENNKNTNQKKTRSLIWWRSKLSRTRRPAYKEIRFR